MDFLRNHHYGFFSQLRQFFMGLWLTRETGKYGAAPLGGAVDLDPRGRAPHIIS